MIENKQKFGIDGRHKLTLCDIRHPQAKRLESEIVHFIKSEDQKISEATRNFHFAKATDRDASNILKFLKTLKTKKHNTLNEMYDALRLISCTHFVEVHNIIPTAGRSVIAQWITGDNTYDAANGANYGSLGTDNTAPANGDTTLGTETYRKATSSVAQSNNVATLSNFYTATEVTGTFEEAGWHIDGGAGADTGQLLSHFLTGTTVKSATETLTVQSVLTIS
jgi:hypothetical protein